MEYHRYLAILRRYALGIVLLTALGGVAATVVALRQPKVYRATVTLLINPAAPNQAIPYLQFLNNSGSVSLIQQLASTYDTYLHSWSFARTIVAQLGLSASPDQLAAQISTELVGTTNFFRISVEANSPLIAARNANTVALEFISQNTTLQEQQASGLTARVDPQLLSYLHNEITQVTHLDAQLTQKYAASTSTADQQALAAVEARLNSLTASYNQTLTAQSAANAGAQLNTATVTDPARPPTVPISPNIERDILLGIAAGLLISLFVAFGLDYFDYSLRSPEDVEEATGQLPLAVIGLIGATGERRERRTAMQRLGTSSTPMAAPQSVNKRPRSPHGQDASDTLGALPNLITLLQPNDPISEAFRALRTNLAFSTLNKPVRSMVVTSVMPSEGKSTIASNIAVVLAQSGKRVIIVDTDLRRPSLHRVFGVRNVNGFSDLLLEGGDVSRGLQATSVPNLWLVTSGSLPPNPAEMLSSDAVVPFIEQLSAQADMLIFDSPPMGGLTDAVVLSTRVEGTLVVVRAGLARPSVVINGIDSLKKVGARSLGVVLNMVDLSALRDNSYYYYYAQSNYYYSDRAKTGQQSGVAH